MTKNKLLFLRDFLLLIATLVILALAIIALVSGDSRPNQESYSYIIGLSIPAIILFSILLAIYWSFRKSYIVLIPLIALAINYNSILNNIQFRFNNKEYSKLTSKTIRIASFNIHEFIYENDITSLSKLIEFLDINKIDVVCFQEFNSPGFLNASELNSSFSTLPFSYIKKAEANSIGMAIFSRYPIVNSGILDFENSGNGVLWSDIQIEDNKVVRVINNHLQTTNLSRDRDAKLLKKIDYLKINSIIRAGQAEHIRALIDSTKGPLIVCGDFNDTPLSYTYSTIKGNNLIDGFREAGSGLGGTYRGMGGMFRIDYILHSKEFRSVKYSNPKIKISDHKPVVSELEFI
ncbi:MAG: endonuclease/exonuclease/phosphatase family protein [Bacteroidales bacterium]|jgi:endonuclease/exonuclease/phosphatase family metal-dependent hydrolase|nr:endonuclease/exonuclease/phosphatase family protein [Bacteroidales bacterium]